MIDEQLIIFLLNVLGYVAIYLMVNVSLNFEYGFTGIPNFGKVLAVAGGAFVVGAVPGRILASQLNLFAGYRAVQDNPVLAECLSTLVQVKPKLMDSIDYIEDNAVVIDCVRRVLVNDPVLSIALLVAMVGLAAIVGAGLGFIASYPSIRLREDYLAMTLLAMGEFLRQIGYLDRTLVGGTLGVAVPDPYGWLGGLRPYAATLVMLTVAVLFFLYVRSVTYSPAGRVLRAVRDSEMAAEVLGIDVVRVKQKILVVSSMMAAVAGALWAFNSVAVIANNYDRFTWTFWPWVMVIIGGAGNNRGVLLGTLVFVILRQAILTYNYLLEPFIPFSIVWLDRLLFGIALIIVLIIRPQGIVPEKPTPAISFEKIRKMVQKS
ncbi:branched-chain amino acid ABC transporter permease [Candidatus Caldarchaeum subterraneum]|uniref:Branched-chain amino acid ABC transporter permease n=1 Tax=Caldiarchaeum subterraneum TaxID=311458 RepID=E6N8D8_CALS0|nr:branched-chain amino acid ABC transporter permease [Candidatus Caldarchaeum subterraneum]BAJ48597.1 branched-chain amino acid ABC transporter permease [Candidatus Caldarchaeum subterraneum]BAJ51305.1 branched-chain amino acid ABC transporter permease [Candidatus Caldarchaeum subterraneum]